MSDYRKAARHAAAQHGIDPDVFERQIDAESGFTNPGPNSSGAEGIAQFIPSTAASLGVNARDPISSLNGAAKLMASYVRKYGSYDKALRAYNAGPGAIESSRNYAETNNYVAKILHGSTPSVRSVPTHTPSAGSRTASPISTPATPTADPQRAQGLALLAGMLQRQHRGGALLASGLLSPDDVADTTTAPKTPRDLVRNAKPTRPSQVAPVPSTKTARFEGHTVAAWMLPALKYARRKGWQGSVNSGVRSTAEQAVLYQRYQAGGNIAAKPGQSNHEIQNGGAIDVSDAPQLNHILSGYKGRRPIWAPTVGLNDSVHFSSNGH